MCAPESTRRVGVSRKNPRNVGFGGPAGRNLLESGYHVAAETWASPPFAALNLDRSLAEQAFQPDPMCANYKTTQPTLLSEYFDVAVPGDYRDEIYPGHTAPVVRRSPDSGRRECVLANFGLMPHWAKPDLYRRTYNARTETVAELPSFRRAWAGAQHCVIPVEWIYEPRYTSGRAERWKIAHCGRPAYGIAGLWEWRPTEAGGSFSFTMLTINADDHALMKHFHAPEDEKRMVVILEPAQYEWWLSAPAGESASFFRQYPAERLFSESAPRPGKSLQPQLPGFD